MLAYLSIAYTFMMTCDCVVGFLKTSKYVKFSRILKTSRMPIYMIRFVCIFLFIILTVAFHKFRFTPNLGNVNIFATVVLCGTSLYTRFYEKSLSDLLSKKVDTGFDE